MDSMDKDTRRQRYRKSRQRQIKVKKVMYLSIMEESIFLYTEWPSVHL